MLNWGIFCIFFMFLLLFLLIHLCLSPIFTQSQLKINKTPGRFESALSDRAKPSTNSLHIYSTEIMGLIGMYQMCKCENPTDKKKFQRKKKFSIGCLLLSPLKNIEETAERLLLITHTVCIFWLLKSHTHNIQGRMYLQVQTLHPLLKKQIVNYKKLSSNIQIKTKFLGISPLHYLQ